MALIDYPDESRLLGAANEILKMYPNNMVRMLAGLGTPFQPLMETISAYVKSGAVSPRLRELITLRVAARLDGRYILNQHLDIARQIGMTSNEIASATDGQPSGYLSNAENQVLLLINELLVGMASAAMVGSVKDAVGDEALQQIFLIFSLNCFLVIYSSSLQIEIDKPITVKGNSSLYDR